MTGKTAEPQRNEIGDRRYRVNLTLFVILILLMLLWFHRHLYHYVTETAFIGGTLTLWGGWKLVQSWVKWGLDAAKISLSERILSRPAASEYLVFGLLIAGGLYLATSSIYLVYEGAKKGEDKFIVEVLHHGNPYLKRVDITSFARVAGQPFFLRLTSLDLEFRITDPRGFEPIERHISPWTNLRVKVPLDFKRKDYRLLRLIPGLSLQNRLPKMTDEPTVTYYLRIDCRGESYRLVDLRRQTVYVGASAEDIQFVVDGQSKTEFADESARYLSDRQVPVEDRHDLIANWQNNPRIESTIEFKPDDTVDIAVGRTGEEQLLYNQSITLKEEKTITTIFMERRR